MHMHFYLHTHANMCWKKHPKPLTIVTARKGTKAAVSRGRRLSFFVLNTPIFSEMF